MMPILQYDVGVIVYKITNAVNGKAYVGTTTLSLERRFASHKRSGRGACRALFAAFQKYGVDSFRIEKLADASSRDEMFALERQLIKQHGTYAPDGRGYNLTLGGEGGLGTPKSAQAKARMSEARRRWMATPEGIRQQAHRTQRMLEASRTPDVAARRNAAIRSALEMPEKRERLLSGLPAAQAAYAAASFKRKLVTCGPEHMTGRNIYVSPAGKRACRACVAALQRAYQARRKARFAEAAE